MLVTKIDFSSALFLIVLHPEEGSASQEYECSSISDRVGDYLYLFNSQSCLYGTHLAFEHVISVLNYILKGLIERLGLLSLLQSKSNLRLTTARRRLEIIPVLMDFFLSLGFVWIV